MMLTDIMLTSELDPGAATDFNGSLGPQPTLQEMREAFQRFAEPSRREDDNVTIERSLRRIRDENFVEGDLYANALAAETPADVTPPVLARLVDEGGLAKKHRSFLRILWGRLSSTQKRLVSAQLGEVLDTQIPNGRWASPLQMLAAFGKDGWDYLLPVTRLRLEGAIVNDILAGHQNIFGPNVGRSGVLGTWANTFCRVSRIATGS
jgi:hypothetical protein